MRTEKDLSFFTVVLLNSRDFQSVRRDQLVNVYRRFEQSLYNFSSGLSLMMEALR
jgi:hypothetical protein